MKLIKLLIIPLLAWAFSGCISDNRTDCTLENNTVLVFEYTTDASKKFTDIIDNVDVILYDADGCYMSHRIATRSDMSIFQGMRLTLQPGTYYVVAWGNVGSNSGYRSFVEGTTTLDDFLLEIQSTSNETGDQVYYAPLREKPACRSSFGRTRAAADMSIYEIVVPSGGRVTKTLDFVRAHRTINVWIKGYEESGTTAFPVVGATKLWSGYDFYFNSAASARRDFLQRSRSATISAGTYAKATFHSAMGVIDNNTAILVNSSSGGETVYSVSLRDFVDDNKIEDKDTDEIDILITFDMNLGITVGIPEWIGKPITPGID